MIENFYANKSIFSDAFTELADGKSSLYTFVAEVHKFCSRIPINGITNGNPTVINCVDHGLETGDEIRIHSVINPIEINGFHGKVTVIDDDHFSVNFDSSSVPSYAGGGVVIHEHDDYRKTSYSKSQIINSIVAMQVIRSPDVCHGVSKKPWMSGKQYNVGEYVTVGYDIFVCERKGNGPSTFEPKAGFGSKVLFDDGYEWSLIFSPDNKILKDFCWSDVVPVARVYSLEDKTNRWKAKYGTVGGNVSEIRMLRSGSGYDPNNTKAVVIGDGYEADITPIVSGGVITGFDIKNLGFGYTWAEISIFDESGSGSGAKAEAKITPIRGYGFDAISTVEPDWVLINGRFGVPCHEVFPDKMTYRISGIIANPTLFGVPITESCQVFYDILHVKGQSGNLKVGDTVVGESSGAVSVVSKINGDEIHIHQTIGEFFAGERLVSDNFSAIIYDKIVSAKDLWGDLLYYRVMPPQTKIKQQTELLRVAVKVV